MADTQNAEMLNTLAVYLFGVLVFAIVVGIPLGLLFDVLANRFSKRGN